MGYAQTNRFALSLAFVLVLLHVGIDLSAAQGPKIPLGKLTLEGESITRLILRREEDGQREEFRRPEQVIELPVGEYRVEEVHLEGGYTCYASRELRPLVATVGADEQATLKIGAPLRHTLQINRQGRCLTMDYALVGAGGEQYSGGNRGEAPGFHVYQGDKELASGKFESG
jgi:hypothetical protein